MRIMIIDYRQPWHNEKGETERYLNRLLNSKLYNIVKSFKNDITDVSEYIIGSMETLGRVIGMERKKKGS